MTVLDKADILEGYAVLSRALWVIGDDADASDHRLAKVITDGELKVRALMEFALQEAVKLR